MQVFLYKTSNRQDWRFVIRPEMLPKGSYKIAGPYGLKTASFLKEIYNRLPFLPANTACYQVTQTQASEKVSQGMWRLLKTEEDFQPGDLIKPGIIGLKWRCVRCGSQNIDTAECALCGRSNCLVCRDCCMLGPVRGCQLYLWQKPEKPLIFQRDLEPNIPFTLTAGQKNAAKKLRKALKLGKRKLLLHAACGAGKTEVASLLIADALNCGHKILYAVPRRDVALEVGERLREYFPQIETVILYGGSTEKYLNQRMVSATTHQVIKFYKAFDFAIIDEGDAFPFKGNPLLVQAVNRATTGPVVYMTATPTDEMLKEFNKEEIVFIPARHHKRALPVPEFSSATLEDALKDVKPPLLLFVPFKKEVDSNVKKLKKLKSEWKVCGISSDTKDRAALIQGLKEGSIDALVSTSVLERGITVNDVTVVVLNADCDIIYTREVLVQIAGRAGRTVSCPEGEVVFLAKKPNKAMQCAKREIVALNTMAKERGEILC
ncbi:MAG: helicase-related protein [Firmicutes bacterium]|nr:helicase-related protein [Bacillota bacterium]